LRNFFAGLFARSIMSKSDIVELLKKAADDKVISHDSIPLIEAAIRLDDLRAKDIMLPRHQMDVLDIDDSIEHIVAKFVATGHSRFPVIDGEVSNLIGVFHTKDLVKFLGNQNEFNLKDHLREVCFVPEIKRLDGLMYEMRLQHLHLAIVVDEFTNIVGLITLEMIIEQVIGDIEDEYDSVEGEHALVELPHQVYRVKGYCKLNELNVKMGLELQDDVVETVGGYLIKLLGRVPLSHEILDLQQLHIEIINSDSRKINLLTIKKSI